MIEMIYRFPILILHKVSFPLSFYIKHKYILLFSDINRSTLLTKQKVQEVLFPSTTPKTENKSIGVTKKLLSMKNLITETVFSLLHLLELQISVRSVRQQSVRSIKSFQICITKLDILHHPAKTIKSPVFSNTFFKDLQIEIYQTNYYMFYYPVITAELQIQAL